MCPAPLQSFSCAVYHPFYSLLFGGRCTLPVSAPGSLSFTLPPALECLWCRSAGGWGQALQLAILKSRPYSNCLCACVRAHTRILEWAEMFSGMSWWFVQLGWPPSRDHVSYCLIFASWTCAGETGTAYLFLPLWNIPVQQRQGERGKADSGTDMLCVVTSSGRQQSFQKPTVFISVRSRMYPSVHLCD